MMMSLRIEVRLQILDIKSVLYTGDMEFETLVHFIYWEKLL